MKYKIAIIAIATFFTLYGTNVTKAASAYDNHYQLADEVVIDDDSAVGSAQCDPISYQIQNFASPLLSEERWSELQNSYKANDYAYIKTLRSSFISSFENGDWLAYLRDGSNGRKTLKVAWSQTSNIELYWTEYGVGARTADNTDTINSVEFGIQESGQTGGYTACNLTISTSSILSDGTLWPSAAVNTYISTPDGSTKSIITNVTHYNYPAGYQGRNIRAEIKTPTALTPDYGWQINEAGDLKITYLKNLPYFLTGTNYVVIDKMNEKWNGIDSNLTTLTVQPAGWLDETHTLPSGAGYYMIRVDHDQQLDSPPWPDQDVEPYTINQRWIQVYWDGENAASGTTVGCSGICNDFTENDPGFGKGAEFDQYGLQSMLLAPIEFIAKLPALGQSCTPITGQLGWIGSMTIPCLKETVYQPHFGAMLALYQTVITGLTAYWVSIKILGTIKDMQSPDKDRIEVAQL